MGRKKFDFIQEVKDRNIRVDLLKYGECCVLVNTIKDMDQSDAEDFVFTNSCAHVSMDDETFLKIMTQIYDQDYLKSILDSIETIQVEEENPKILLMGEERYDMEVH